MKVLVIGDSHSKLLNLTHEIKDSFPNSLGVKIKVISLSGATIRGFGKRESTLSSKDKLIESYHEFKPDYLCFSLGQVDLELGIYYKEIIKGETVDYRGFINELVDLYLMNIKEVQGFLNIENENIIIKGVNLTTLCESRQKAVLYTSKIITENIENKDKVSIYTQQLKERLPPNTIRNKNHNQFNSLLQKLSEDRGYCYFDINESIINKSTGNVRKEFLPSANDHHLVDSLYIRELHIQSLLSSISRCY